MIALLEGDVDQIVPPTLSWMLALFVFLSPLGTYITNVIRRSHQLELRRKRTPNGHGLIREET